jgi:septum formation protein
MIRLASGSPRRRELLALLGVPFEVVPADVDERIAPRPAMAKALAVARPGTLTLAADTLIDLDGELIGKPADSAGAMAMLHKLAGRSHTVRTEAALIAPSGRPLRFVVRTTVAMKPADDAAIRAYVATGEPLDRAGAYAIQGGGKGLVAWYDGCYANVVGLPLCHVFFGLRKLGLGVPERPEPAFARAFGFECPAWRIAYGQGRALRDGQEYDTGRRP